MQKRSAKNASHGPPSLLCDGRSPLAHASHAASTARRMAPTESIRAAAGDLALAYAWTVVCFRAWDDALER